MSALGVVIAGDIDWKERALRWEREAQRLNEEAGRLKGEVEDWKARFETLLEASLQQINRLPDDDKQQLQQTRSTPSSPHSSNGNSSSQEEHEKGEFKKTTSKKGRFFVSFSHILGSEEKGKKKERKDSKEKDKVPDRDGKGELKKGGSSELYNTDEPTDFSPSLTPSTPYQHLPRLQVCQITSKLRTAVLVGPDGDKGEAFFQENVAGKSVSTYPFIPGNPIRDGDPIADRFCVQIYDNRLIACVADGCNWGEKPREAACKATNAFLDYVNNNHDAMVDVKKAGVVLLNGFEYAHNAIMEGKEAFWEAGTTTLLGGVLLEINKGTDKWTPQWEFVCCSVGDCKAFCYANGEISDITQGNRRNVSDPRDCGGRLGPHLDEGKPDLRNLNLFCASCEEGDIIFIVTDGVYDNLDPQHLGKLPKDMPKEFNLHGDRWDDVDASKATKAKNQFVTQLLTNLLEGTNEPKQITDRLVDHCIMVTKKSREYMENNGGKKIPDDYGEFPGKMDHTTCLCFRVGRNPLPQIPSPVSSPSSSPTTSLSTSTASNTPPTPKDNWTKISPTLKH